MRWSVITRSRASEAALLARVWLPCTRSSTKTPLRLFQEARRLDEGFALAYWGEAMTYHQSLWGHEDSRRAVRRWRALAPTPAERTAKARTPKDKGVARRGRPAVWRGRRGRAPPAVLRRDGPFVCGRSRGPRRRVFYALALLGTMSRGLIGTADAHEGHVQSLAGSATQTRVGENPRRRAEVSSASIRARSTICCTTTTTRRTRGSGWRRRAP